jgi:class 3 adenylate cyclase/two-component SAPR family response regulator
VVAQQVAVGQGGQVGQVVQVRLLGTFAVTSAGRAAGPWPRPSARRLCQLVFVSAGRRISRDLACEELFPDLDPRAAARSVSKALSMARGVLAGLGPPGASLLAADLTHIWASPAAWIDAQEQEAALRTALAMAPGRDRDDLLVAALADEAELLADEPYADWALRPRERLEALCQDARLTLARDRAKGAGHAQPEAVLQAWEACFEHDAACEEAAAALAHAYLSQGRRELAVRVYERCAAALDELGLGISPSLAELFAVATAQAHATRPVLPAEELRTVSVLAAEVAAPPGLAARLGLENLRDAVSGSLTAVIAAVEALGGTVTSVSGGGLQAMFGAPQAHEDDPERAVRAAFRALSAVAAPGEGGAGSAPGGEGGAGPALRIGVETGPALVGPIGGGTRVEYTAVGDVVGIATALQSAARPGSALVGPATRAATGHLFTWGGNAELTLGPDVQPVVASYLDSPRATPAGRRLRVSGRMPLVGRQRELDALGRALRDMARGAGSVVLLTGEPGLGKTRLVHECRGRFPVARWLEGRCTSYASATPYGLYQQLLASWVGVAADQPDAVLRPALERALAAIEPRSLADSRRYSAANPPTSAMLARVLGLAGGPGGGIGGGGAGRMDPHEQHQAMFGALQALISRLVAAGPVVLVLEDLHWADPTSLHLTVHLARLAVGRRLLLLATSRPELDPELAQIPPGVPVHHVVLGPLPQTAERKLAQSLAGGVASQEVLDTVLSSTDGNPLFLQERFSSLVETGVLVRDQGEWRISEGTGPEMPQALERLVRSRVDRLSPAARDAIRAASVIGAEFSLDLLGAVRSGGDPLEPVLDELCAKDLVQQAAERPDPVFRFRHALIQEAIYTGLLRAERRRLHGRVAWALEALTESSRGRLAEAAAVLGRHFAAAEEAAHALKYLELAGDHATDAFANDEAISSYRAALALENGPLAARLNAKLANVLWRTARRAEARTAFHAALRVVEPTEVLLRAHLLTRLGRLEMAEQRYDDAASAFDAAQALLGANPADQDDATVDQWLELMLDGRADLYGLAGDEERAMTTLEAARPLLEARGTPARRYAFYHVLSISRVIRNRYRVDETDIANARLGLAAAAAGDDQKDIGYATFFVGYLLLLYDDLSAAQEQLERSLVLAERIGEAILLAVSLTKLTITALRRRDTEAVRALAHRAVIAGDAMGGAYGAPEATACLAWLAWQDGRPQDVIELVEQIEEQEPTATVVYHTSDGVTPQRWIYLWPLIAVHLDDGNIAEAVAAAQRMLHPAQQRLPDELAAAVAAASRAWAQGQAAVCAHTLTAALALARDLRYC